MSTLSLLFNTLEAACLNAAMNSFWSGHSEKCSVDAKAFQSSAASNKYSSLYTTYKKHENIKCSALLMANKSQKWSMPFMLLVLPAIGRLAHEATTFYNHLASLLSTK